MSNDQISKSLDMNPVEPEKETSIVPTESKELVEQNTENNKSEQEMEADFNYARKNLYDAIERGNDAMEQMLDLAKASEHPRAYEVFGTLMKNLVEANKDLVQLSKNKNSEKVKENTNEKQNITNNHLHVGSTSDIQKLIKDLNENNND